MIWKMDVLQDFQYQLTSKLSYFSKAIKISQEDIKTSLFH